MDSLRICGGGPDVGIGVEVVKPPTSISKDSFKVAGDEECLHQPPPGHRIYDMILHNGSPILLKKEVRMYPKPVGPAPLLIHETMRRIPHRDLALPVERQAVQPQAVINQRPQSHLDWAGGDDSEVQPWRSQGFQIGRVREECKYVFAGAGEPLLCLKGVCFHDDSLLTEKTRGAGPGLQQEQVRT